MRVAVDKKKKPLPPWTNIPKENNMRVYVYVMYVMPNIYREHSPQQKVYMQQHYHHNP